MRVKIKNWRCIKEVEFDLSRINVFLGQNATGKSSLAYALYLLSKAPKLGKIQALKTLYGLDYKSVVRVEKDKPCYPVEIIVDKYSIKIDKRQKSEITENLNEVKNVVPSISENSDSPWNDEYLLPSGRVAYFQALRYLPKLAKEIQQVIPLAIDFLKPILGEFLFPPAQVFFSDLNRALTGYRIEPVKGSLKSLGDYIVEITPLTTLFTFTVYDPFTRHKIPAEIAPDGQADQMIIDIILERALEKSLVVIEEPEIYKNPVFQFEIMEKISELAIKKI
jgi:AAA15 family ATPase/GTPase